MLALLTIDCLGRKSDHGEDQSRLIHQLEPPDEVYLILEGTVSVDRNHARLTELGPGEFIGEIAPIVHRLRTATVTARTPLLTLVLPAAEFAQLCRDLPHFDAAVTAVATARLAELDQATQHSQHDLDPCPATPHDVAVMSSQSGRGDAATARWWEDPPVPVLGPAEPCQWCPSGLVCLAGGAVVIDSTGLEGRPIEVYGEPQRCATFYCRWVDLPPGPTPSGEMRL